MLTEPITYISVGNPTPLLCPTLSQIRKPVYRGHDLWKSSALCCGPANQDLDPFGGKQ